MKTVPYRAVHLPILATYTRTTERFRKVMQHSPRAQFLCDIYAHISSPPGPQYTLITYIAIGSQLAGSPKYR